MLPPSPLLGPVSRSSGKPAWDRALGSPPARTASPDGGARRSWARQAGRTGSPAGGAVVRFAREGGGWTADSETLFRSRRSAEDIGLEDEAAGGVEAAVDSLGSLPCCASDSAMVRWRSASIRGSLALDVNRGGAVPRLVWSAERVRKARRRRGPNGVRATRMGGFAFRPGLKLQLLLA
jgi:hypothetical protein